MFEVPLEQEAGIFTWDLEQDRVYGDTAIAALFHLDPQEVIKGLPLMDYLSRIHADDRSEVARLISETVKEDCPYYAEYRTVSASGEFQWVMATGRCFRDPKGSPILYSGIIYPVEKLTD